jgi:hypothetical protein
MFFDKLGKYQGSTESPPTKTNRRLKAEVERRAGGMKVNQGWSLTGDLGQIRGKYHKALTASR